MNLGDFVNPSEPRPYLRKPFVVDGRTVGCNGHICISTPGKTGRKAPEATTERLREALAEARDAKCAKPGKIKIPKGAVCCVCDGSGKVAFETCHECGGEGEVETRTAFNSYYPTCKSCDGEGETKIPGAGNACVRCAGSGTYWLRQEHVDIAGILVAPRYARLIADDKDARVAASKCGHMLLFQSGNDYGLIMGMRI